MASLGVLASLMTNQYPDIKTYDPMDVARLTSQRTANQTNLLALEDLRRQQQTAAEARAFMQQHPEMFLGAGGQPLLASLGTPAAPAAGAPPPGPITQQTFGSSGPGATQTIAAPADLSQFATGTPVQGGMPGSTIAGLRPQANPLMQLMRQSPDAARLLQERMQQQEEQGYKRQEQGLKMREKVAESFGQLLGGAHDQASYDVIRRQLAQVSPEWAAALPQVYSAEGVQPFIDAAIDAKSRAQLGIQHVEAQAAMMKAKREGISTNVNELLGSIGKTWESASLPERQWALKEAEASKTRIAAANVTPQLIQGEGGGYWAVNPRTLEKRAVPGEGAAPPGGGSAAPGGQAAPESQLRAPMSSEDKKQAGYLNRAQEGQKQLEALEAGGDYTAWTAPVQKYPGGRLLLSDKQRQYETAKGVFLQGILRRDSAGQITQQEWDDYGRIYFPQPNDGPADVEHKRQLRQQYLESERSTLGRPSGQQAPSGGQSSQAPPSGKVVSRAALHEEARRRNVSPQQAEQMAIAKGYRVQ